MKIKHVGTVLFACLFVLGCGGMGDGCCGYSHKDVSGSGQVKKVGKSTPLVCPDYYTADISLGVMRNGVGSMSTHDMNFYVEGNLVEQLKQAAEQGSIVDFTYDVRRVTVCVDEPRITSIKVLKQ